MRSETVELWRTHCEYFNIDAHSGVLENVSITFIDKTDISDPDKQVNYLIQTLKTMVSWDLNVLGNSDWSNLDCNKCSFVYIWE